jgi:hypothetical protein
MLVMAQDDPPQRSLWMTGSIAPSSRREAWDLESGSLVFLCPNTQQEIDVGIEMDRSTFLRIRGLRVSVICPACQGRHEFTAASGSLAPSG